LNNPVFYPPSRVLPEFNLKRVFLAGAIDMGAAEDWQQKVIDYSYSSRVAFFNPRRPDWDSHWNQSLDDPHFAEQVNWELDMIAQSDVVFFHFPADSKAPISLMELGIASATPDRVIISAEPGYWRRGNIEVLCNRLRIPLHTGLNGAMLHLFTYMRVHQ